MGCAHREELHSDTRAYRPLVVRRWRRRDSGESGVVAGQLLLRLP